MARNALNLGVKTHSEMLYPWILLQENAEGNREFEVLPVLSWASPQHLCWSFRLQIARSFTTVALDRREWLASRSCSIILREETPGNAPNKNCGPQILCKSGVDAGNFCLCQEPNPVHQAHNIDSRKTIKLKYCGIMME